MTIAGIIIATIKSIPIVCGKHLPETITQ